MHGSRLDSERDFWEWGKDVLTDRMQKSYPCVRACVRERVCVHYYMPTDRVKLIN